MRLKWSFIACLILLATSLPAQQTADNIIQLIFTSDAHYGIKRNVFRGDSNVDAHIVNAAMIDAMNQLSHTSLPNDNGVNAGAKNNAVDYIIEGGDIGNRMEVPVQSSAISWKQFYSDYTAGLQLTNNSGQPTAMLAVAGNHDISNAVGFYKHMQPVKDASVMAELYNTMMHPSTPVTADNYAYATGKIHYSKNIGNIHCMFLCLWPDSSERVWMEKDLSTIDANMPVIIFTHDQPECEPKHFINPNSPHDINSKDRFENLLSEVYKDGNTVNGDGATAIEQRALVAFLQKHPSIKAYFHGNSNYNEFYTYHGPDNNVSVPVFRVDSPIKGKYSADDETKLSFQFISIDTNKKMITVRECLWNTKAAKETSQLVWGESKTISLE
jgi:hypothetical protein